MCAVLLEQDGNTFIVPFVAFGAVAVCGKRDFKRRRRYVPYTFFYRVAGNFGQLLLNMQAQSVCVRDEVDLRYWFITTYEFG